MGFLQATRQNFLSAPVITYALGQTGYSRIPKVGFLKRIFVLFAGTLSVTLGGGTVALGLETPFSIISRIRLVANGNTALFDMSGWGAMIASLFSAHSFSGYGGRPIIPDTATVPGVAATAMSAANFTAAAADASAWRFALEIPLALSDDWRTPVGLLLAAAPDTELSLEVTFGGTLYSTAAANRTIPLVSTGAATATMAATITPVVEFFTVPGSRADYPPLDRIHTWSEFGPQVIAANGDQDVVIPRGNTALRIIHDVFTNSAADGTHVDALELRFNQNEVPYRLTRQALAVLQRKRMVRDLPDGLYVHDLFNTGTLRDAVNTLNLNEITSRLTISGATIAGTSDVRTFVEQLIKLSGVAAGSA